MKPSPIALLLVPLFVLALALPGTALAEDEEGASGDLKERIKKKMEGILELMKQNEAALLKLSTGKAAVTKKVDVEVPEPPAGASGASGSSGAAGAQGKEIGRKLDELIKGQRASGGKIPDELKQLVEMIPL